MGESIRQGPHQIAKKSIKTMPVLIVFLLWFAGGGYDGQCPAEPLDELIDAADIVVIGELKELC